MRRGGPFNVGDRVEFDGLGGSEGTVLHFTPSHDGFRGDHRCAKVVVEWPNGSRETHCDHELRRVSALEQLAREA